MKSSLLLALALSLSGCGLKLVNKDNLLAGLNKAHTEVTNARFEACSPYVTDKIDNTSALLQALIRQFE